MAVTMWSPSKALRAADHLQREWVAVGVDAGKVADAETGQSHMWSESGGLPTTWRSRRW